MNSYISGKQRASRIPLDYYKHPDPLVRRKRLLTLVAGVVSVAWIFSLLPFAESRGPLGMSRFSHGSVASAHASFESDCSACHVNFGLFASKHSSDQKCQNCHLAGDLATHHASQKVDLTPNCGTCHSDHHGREFSLTRIGDTGCTDCHKDLSASMDGSPHGFANVVTSFATEHPGFRDLDKGDPGKLKFNHKYHMTPGIVLAEGGKAFTLGDIPADLRGRYVNAQANKNANAPVVLQCGACHAPAGGDELARPGSANADDARSREEVQTYFKKKQELRPPMKGGHGRMPPSKPGAYMAPVDYNTHCAACHPLTFARGLGPAEHYKQPDELRAYLRGVYKEEYKTRPETLTQRPASFFPLPGKGATTTGPAKPGPEVVEEKVEQAMRLLLEGKRACGECHVAQDGSAISLLTKAIAKPNIPRVWMEHARFDHNAHSLRGIDCKQCHPDAYDTGDKDRLAAYSLPRKGAEKVMIAGIDNCRQCHVPSPAERFAEAGLKGRSDCTECHVYHQGKVEGVARANGVDEKLRRELQAWLRQPRRK